MRTPQNTLLAVLAASLGAALGVTFGGLGGLAVRLRALRQRVDGHDDELESFGRRVSRREGAAGREAQREQGSKLEREARELLARVGQSGNGKPHSDRELLASLDGLPDRIWPRKAGAKGEAEE